MKATRNLIACAVLLLLCVGMVACARGGGDEQIVRSIQSNIATDSGLANRQIRVDSNAGVVTLSGNVSNDAERTLAANDAARVEGVKTVVNNLQVAPVAARAEAASRPLARSTSAPVAVPAGPSSASSGTVTLPEGTDLSVRMIDSVDSDRNKAGDTFRASLAGPLMLGDRMVAPKDADVQGRVVELASAGRFAGRSSIALELTSLTVGGRSYQLETDQYAQHGGSRGKRTAAVVGGTAAAGAVIGGVVGGGKGAAIGAASGAGAGTAVEAATKGEQVHVPSETILDFRLKVPLTVVPSATGVRARN